MIPSRSHRVSERHTRVILVLLLLGQLALLTAQVAEPTIRGPSLERITFRVLAPLSRIVAGAFDAAGRLRTSLRSHRHLREENAALQQEIERLRRQQAGRDGLELEVERLSRALRYGAPPRGDVLVADVVYIDHASWLRTLVLYASAPGLEVNQPVTSVDGLLGRVVLVSGRYGKVQLVTDRASSVGAMIQRTRRQGIVRGADKGTLALDYVPLQADVRPGDRVVTAGIDGVFFRGILIGTVTEVEPGDELFHRIRLVPAVDFGLLDQVYVLGREPLPDELREGHSAARP